MLRVFGDGLVQRQVSFNHWEHALLRQLQLFSVNRITRSISCRQVDREAVKYFSNRIDAWRGFDEAQLYFGQQKQSHFCRQLLRRDQLKSNEHAKC